MRIQHVEIQIKLLLLIILFLSYPTYSQNFNSQVEAIINSNDNKDDLLEITGVAKNLTETNYSLYYELSVIKTSSKKNVSRNEQSGRFTLEAYEAKTLSTTSVNIGQGVRTVVLLLIYDEKEKLLGKNRLVYNGLVPEKEEPTISYKKKNEGIQLTGIVTENTKTKPGKDFYDFFYQKYQLSPKKINAMILVDEHISFGRTTRIMVKADDKIIHQFYARPKLDYLKEQADITLKHLNKYLQYLENRSEYKNQY